MRKTNVYADNSFTSSELKTILHPKRANIFYLQYCRVLQKDGRALYLTEDDKANQYFNIPIDNTTSILLGTGTSITQAAMRLLSPLGVLVGFCGGGGTPLFVGSEKEIFVEWLTPQSEYRPTEYIQGWMSWRFDVDKRLQAAQIMQFACIEFLRSVWLRDKDFKKHGFDSSDANIKILVDEQQCQTPLQDNTMHLLQLEARQPKRCIKLLRQPASRSAAVC